MSGLNMLLQVLYALTFTSQNCLNDGIHYVGQSKFLYQITVKLTCTLPLSDSMYKKETAQNARFSTSLLLKTTGYFIFSITTHLLTPLAFTFGYQEMR